MSKDEADKYKTLVSNLENELKSKENKNSMLEAEIRSLQRRLVRRDNEILKQERELHKLRSVLQQASSLMSQGDDSLLSSIQESSAGLSSTALMKKQGVSGQSVAVSRDINITKHNKDFRSRTIIKEAIMENDFLKNLSQGQVRELVEAVHEKTVAKGCYVIREGELGNHFYVSAEGEYEVIKDGKVLGRLGVGKAFGELAILYNCKRTASIKAVTDGKLWCMERLVFQQIMQSTGIKKTENQVTFLKSVPLLSTFPADILAKISDVLELEVYKKGQYIVREGTSGDTFYIISDGGVRVTKKTAGREEEIRSLARGDYFGEQALLTTDTRTANVIATSDAVECLTLDRESFFQLVGDLSELRDKKYGDIMKNGKHPSQEKIPALAKEQLDVELDDLEVVATLGVGGFGRVELVKCRKKPGVTYALKCLKKQHIVETQQQEHVFSEKNILMSCRHIFITKLYKTFKDRKYIYMLMEASLGGELWTILRDRGWFDDNTTRFYIACVVSAFDYLHSRGIIYRDLKPENLLLDKEGYIKMVDFGFSKHIDAGRKTWTFCGTPEYVAPEIILNKGHDRAVDFWSLGILMYELLTGTPPFTASDPMKVYNIILRGFDQIDVPRHVSRTAVTLMKRFCKENPVERIGYQKDGVHDIKKHRWFQGFDWEGLSTRALTPPIAPKVQSTADTSNFDKYPRDEAVPQDELSGWDKDF